MIDYLILYSKQEITNGFLRGKIKPLKGFKKLQVETNDQKEKQRQ